MVSRYLSRVLRAHNTATACVLVSRQHIVAMRHLDLLLATFPNRYSGGCRSGLIRWLQLVAPKTAAPLPSVPERATDELTDDRELGCCRFVLRGWGTYAGTSPRRHTSARGNRPRSCREIPLRV